MAYFKALNYDVRKQDHAAAEFNSACCTPVTPSTDMDAIELSQTSTPNERQHFHDFKKKLLGRKAVSNLRKARENESHQQQSNDQHCELKEKSELLKVRLHECMAWTDVAGDSWVVERLSRHLGGDFQKAAVGRQIAH